MAATAAAAAAVEVLCRQTMRDYVARFAPAFRRMSSLRFSTYRTGRPNRAAATAAAAAGGIWRLDLPPNAPPTRRHSTFTCGHASAVVQKQM